MWKIFRWILVPFSVLFGVIIRLRHWLYDVGIKKSKKYQTPIICVGNIRVGGTGKTPATEYLIKLLKNAFSVAVISRGYGRKTRGFVLADSQSNAEIIGDEPFQYYRKFSSEIRVAVDENRQRAIDFFENQPQKTDVYLLDDAFQHRKITPKFSIILTPFNDLYTDDFLLPVGRLRDVRSRAKKANCIIVSKSPKNISPQEQQKILRKINPEKYQSVFFSYVEYSDNVYSTETQIALNQWIKSPFLLVTGIANPQPMIDFLNDLGANFRTKIFPDHHNFSVKEIQNLQKETRILTTEKDFTRLANHIPSAFFLPIEMKIIGQEQEKIFQKQILKNIENESSF